ncbi:hypothetical protein BFJ68_g1986 [Fusarium oxysporum]|uniref:Secreted in xylem 1 n=1 Tax=Fusarium oxysporum TaxID=5507 RepID=A0A420RXA9_FUSOX|nr:hypothetical protein BFJ68_g1986 [Fusarium oxysporum]
MQHQRFLLLSVVLLPSACLSSRYGIVVPEWEVEVTSGSTTVLEGTIEEIHEELLQLNPNWDEEYMSNFTQAAADTEKRDSDKHLFGRTNFNGAKYTCRGRWPECHTAPIVRGVEYLRYVQGKPKNGPGPGNCGRVSCSNNAAIWWCNDNASSKTLNGFGSIADGAGKTVATEALSLDKCSTALNGTSLCERTSAKWADSLLHAKPRISERTEGNRYTKVTLKSSCQGPNSRRKP